MYSKVQKFIICIQINFLEVFIGPENESMREVVGDNKPLRRILP